MNSGRRHKSLRAQIAQQKLKCPGIVVGMAMREHDVIYQRKRYSHAFENDPRVRRWINHHSTMPNPYHESGRGRQGIEAMAGAHERNTKLWQRVPEIRSTVTSLRVRANDGCDEVAADLHIHQPPLGPCKLHLMHLMRRFVVRRAFANFPVANEPTL